MVDVRTDAQTRLVGTNLRAIRRQRGLTQSDVAERAGLSRATIAGIEGARYESIELSTLARIAQALRVDATALLAAPLEENRALAEFRSSVWFAAIAPSEDEMAWLNALPIGLLPKATPRLFVDLLDLRRRHSRG